MYTQCPECLSVFALNATTLGRSRGDLLCACCGTRFNALATLVENLPDQPFVRLESHAATASPVMLEEPIYPPQPAPTVLPTPEDPLPAVTHATLAHEDFSQLVFTPRPAKAARRRRKPPSYRHLRRPSPHRGWWTAACVILLLLLTGQLAWAEREFLITQPTTGHWLRAGCAALLCTLPLAAAPERLQVVDSNVQGYPGTAHALLISARIRNTAAFAQPYPMLVVTLSDANGKRLAMRRLRPSEYQDDAQALRRGLGPGESSVLMLEVADPGDRAVEFELGFE
jgi:predicted Zn finger-like uncharacterized protein